MGVVEVVEVVSKKKKKKTKIEDVETVTEVKVEINEEISLKQKRKIENGAVKRADSPNESDMVNSELAEEPIKKKKKNVETEHAKSLKECEPVEKTKKKKKKKNDSKNVGKRKAFDLIEATTGN